MKHNNRVLKRYDVRLKDWVETVDRANRRKPGGGLSYRKPGSRNPKKLRNR